MLALVIAQFTQKHFRSFDGTEIAYQTVGPQNASGMPLVLANGLGGNHSTWLPMLERLSQPRRVITWDYRGLYGSRRPIGHGTLGPAEQVRDVELLLEHEGVERAVFVGWSMGVQVNFEAVRRMPRKVAGLVAVNGVAGRPFRTALPCGLLCRAIPGAITLMRKYSPLIGPLTHFGLRIPGLFPAMARLGLVGSVDVAMFTEFARGFASLDFDLYGQTLAALGEHDAHDVLARIKCPFTVVAGDRDVMTPLKTAHRIIDQVPHGRLRILHGGTHYTPVEFPDEVAAEIERVVAEAEAGALSSAQA